MSRFRAPVLLLDACLVLGLLGASREPIALAARYRIEGVSDDGRRTSGELTLEAHGQILVVTRDVTLFPEEKRDLRRAEVRRDTPLEITFDGARALYRSDGCGGLTGNYEGPKATYRETLSPLPAPDDGVAALASARTLANPGAALARAIARHAGEDAAGIVLLLAERGSLSKSLGDVPAEARSTLAALELGAKARDALATEGEPRLVVALARAARRDSLLALRTFVDALVRRGSLYRTLDAATPEDRRSLTALVRAVTPDVSPEINEAFERALLLSPPDAGSPYEILIVPGHSAGNVPRLHSIDAEARERCSEAARAFRDGLAPFVLASGGAVLPEGTPVVEAFELAAELVRLGVPRERIALEPRARHSTTNLRNAGRFMLRHGLTRGLVVTGKLQTFYFSHPDLSTFGSRCTRELGFVPGRLTGVDSSRTAFSPSPRCHVVNENDPLDP